MHTCIIAEAGVNHNGDLGLAQALIDVAAEAGVDYVKFQTFKAAQLVSPRAAKAAYQKANLPTESDSQMGMLKRLELDVAAHHKLIDYCALKGIPFLSTPFDLDSITLLHQLGIPLFKIPSGEITNKPYLEKIAAYQKEVILSSGMSTLGEIEQALQVLQDHGTPREKVTVLHCNTEYPTPMQDVHLRAMNTIGDALGVKVGYSDHTLGIEVPIAAVARGAVCIEKHFTLDRNMEGPDHRASLEPSELKAMVAAIRNIEKALGQPLKRPSSSEQKNIAIARKSIHLAHALPAGHRLVAEDLLMVRPGDGLSPMWVDWVIGRTLRQNCPDRHQLQVADLA